MPFDKIRVRSAFDRTAAVYDSAAVVQQHMAGQLARLLPWHSDSILEFGPGTGIYTALLRQRYPRAQLTIVDFAPEMLAKAQARIRSAPLTVKIDDAENGEVGSGYSLITANACFQWFTDFAAAMRRYAPCLVSGGELTFSTFGPQTLGELQQALAAAAPALPPIPAARFLSAAAVRHALAEAGFRAISVAEEAVIRECSDGTGLFRSMRATSGAGRSGGLWTPRRWKRLLESYPRFDGRWRATYQVLYVRATV
ncbi:MAG: methyltransferase domain-containing protein [Candidatus Omnitrophica bacterium]|nr:methyltransferase domain-containing protein [Candidatus Omnitrophota bacterium]